MQPDNEQHVVSFTNKITFEQAWFNVVRASKPQTFTSGCASSMLDEVAAADTTGGPAGTCEFCKWVTNTAEDTFGRIDTGSVVTASNLFKYCEPGHGLLLFKHHDPLAFSATDIGHLLHAADCWFKAAAATHNSAPSAVDGTAEETSMTQRRLWPMLLWNTLPRAGASQFHGHAQVALSQVPFPSDMLMMQQAERYEREHVACCYNDTRRVHAAIGLAHQLGPPEDRAYIYASLTPCKDAEIVVHGQNLASPTFAVAFHTALRALIDDLGCPSWNAAVQPLWDARARVSAAAQPFADCRVVARVVSRGKLSNRASDFGGLEVFAGASIGHTDPYAVHAAVGRRLADVT